MQRNRITGTARAISAQAREAAEEAGHDAASRAGATYHQVIGLGERALGAARGQARHLAEDAYETGRELSGAGMKALSRQAGAHPLLLVLAAGAAGAAIGWLLTSRR